MVNPDLFVRYLVVSEEGRHPDNGKDKTYGSKDDQHGGSFRWCSHSITGAERSVNPGTRKDPIRRSSLSLPSLPQEGLLALASPE